MKKILTLLLSISFLSCTLDSDKKKSLHLIDDALPTKLVSKVVKITDGDTIALRYVYNGDEARQYKGKNLRIRFAHIDTPERGKAFYQVAKRFVGDACEGKEVTIIHEGEFDSYGRLIGEVILPNGENLNKQEVAAGLAIHFKKYSDNEEYAILEETARLNKLKVWSLPEITMAYPDFYERVGR